MDIGSTATKMQTLWRAGLEGATRWRSQIAGGRAIRRPSLRPPSLFSGLGRSRSGRVLCVAAVLGLALRLVILAATAGLEPKIVDEQHFTQLANNLVRGNGFAWGAGELTSIRPPLYPVVVAAIWRVTGEGSFQVVRALQILIGMLTAWLVYLLGRRVYGEDTGRYAAAAVWLYPTLIFFNFTILTEGLFTLLLVMFVLLSVRLIQAPTATQRDRVRRRPRLERAHAQRALAAAAPAVSAAVAPSPQTGSSAPRLVGARLRRVRGDRDALGAAQHPPAGRHDHCRYHGWSQYLDGKLRSHARAPDLGRGQPRRQRGLVTSAASRVPCRSA